MARPTLFLIDGSSQMYRAYHAFRGKGLSNQEGQTTHAVYVFVTMLRKLIERSPAALHRRVVRSGGPDVPRHARRRLQGQPRGDARRPGRTDQLGARGVRSAGRADRHRAGLRGRRCDRHAGARARPEAGFEVAIVSIDKDFFQLVRRRHPRLRPARGRRLVRRGGGRREIRRRAVAGGRRARARRRHQRQRRRRARRRQEGRDRSDQRRTAASTRCSTRPPSCRRRSTRGARRRIATRRCAAASS